MSKILNLNETKALLSSIVQHLFILVEEFFIHEHNVLQPTNIKVALTSMYTSIRFRVVDSLIGMIQ
jgi:hypothetical protein